MNTDEVLVDFSLPNNPDTLNFIKLSRHDKLKAIALGMRFLSLGIQQQQLWDNSQWEERLEQVKTQEQGKLIILQEKIQLEKLKTQKLIKTQQSEVDAIIEGVRNRTESKFKGEITTLNNNMERMQNKINLHQTEKAQLYKSLNDDFYCKFLSKEQLWESKIERIRNDYVP